MLGSVVKAHTLHESSRFSGSECLPERFPAVRVQVVEHEVNLLGVPVGCCSDTSDLFCKISFGSPVCICDFSAPSFRFHRAEEIASTIAFVFIVSSSRFVWLGGYGCSRVLEELFGLFIKAHDWFFGIVRLLVEIEDVFHVFFELIGDVGHAPHFFPAKV